MTSNVSVYLAGPIQHDPDPNRWREEVIGANTHNNIEFLNPLDIEQYDDESMDPADVVEPDIRAIDDCDALLVRWKDGIQTAGTPMEMIYAQGREKTVVTWYEGQLEELSPWVRYFSDDVVTKGSNAISQIQKLV